MIEINNLTANQVNEGFLKRVAKKVLAGENKEKMELSIVFVGQARIRALNKKYRKKNQATDILTFNYNNSGEMVICFREIKKNARKFGETFEKELTKVLIHGILHLAGYEHEKSEKEAVKMKKKEEYYLNLCQELKL